MFRNYSRLLARFDPIGLDRYGITAKDLETIERYVRILQEGIPQTAWDEAVNYEGEYGTSILIHEIVQIRGLMRAGVHPLRYGQQALSHILEQYLDAHNAALYEEHLYLQEIIMRKYGERFEVATLIKANRSDERDLQSFLESDIGIFLFEEERVDKARQLLARLKEE